MRSILILVMSLGACSNLPDAGYPQLVPLGKLYAVANENSQLEAATVSLQARAGSLRRKAEALRGRSIVDGQERLRPLLQR